MLRVEERYEYDIRSIGLFTSNFIVPYRKENTNDTECSLLDIESCQSRSDLQISNSFEKLR